MIKIIEPKYPIIEPEDFGRRPTSKYDISAILFLMKKSCKKNFVEIGSWYGKTTYEIAKRFPDKMIFTMDYIEKDLILDPASNRALIKDKDDLCKYAKHLPNVSFIYANSHTYDFNKFKNLLYETPDFFFIDGDHSFKGVKTDSEKAMIYLKKNGGGTIAWHDVHTKNLTQVPDYMQSIAKTKNVFYLKNTNIGYIKVS
jgi:predicted O-methyltransferase YrrM